MGTVFIFLSSPHCRDIPSWKQRIAGKSIPMEKFAVKRCERFFAQGNRLVLPAVELLYLWNGFKIVGKQQDLVHPFLFLVEKHIKILEADKVKGNVIWDGVLFFHERREQLESYMERERSRSRSRYFIQ